MAPVGRRQPGIVRSIAPRSLEGSGQFDVRAITEAQSRHMAIDWLNHHERFKLLKRLAGD